MARHTRRLPPNRKEREQATARAAQLLEQLEQQAREVRELEAAARTARKRLKEQIVRHVDARELDISDMARTTGISRQTIHRLISARRRSEPPGWVVGQRVAHPSRGPGTIEKANGPVVTIRFDRPELCGRPHELHTGLAGITPL
jgi:AraC-like DNA-binding protein